MGPASAGYVQFVGRDTSHCSGRMRKMRDEVGRCTRTVPSITCVSALWPIGPAGPAADARCTAKATSTLARCRVVGGGDGGGSSACGARLPAGLGRGSSTGSMLRGARRASCISLRLARRCRSVGAAPGPYSSCGGGGGGCTFTRRSSAAGELQREGAGGRQGLVLVASSRRAGRRLATRFRSRLPKATDDSSTVSPRPAMAQACTIGSFRARPAPAAMLATSAGGLLFDGLSSGRASAGAGLSSPAALCPCGDGGAGRAKGSSGAGSACNGWEGKRPAGSGVIVRAGR
mmetsp:Transcript_12806/g.40188  ORF Transcript_12806/g.40188 Transcript_12806/m.40188 type:complete len:289 (+) Transcript_12806:120-986(+)